LDSKASCLNGILEDPLQLDDVEAVNDQLVKSNNFRNDLMANDKELLNKINSTCEMIMSNCLRRDNDFIKDDLNNSNMSFKILVDDYEKNIQIKNDLKASLDNFNSLNADQGT
jgi:hypothetical protein